MNYKEASLASRSQDGLLLWKLRGKDPPPKKIPIFWIRKVTGTFLESVRNQQPVLPLTQSLYKTELYLKKSATTFCFREASWPPLGIEAGEAKTGTGIIYREHGQKQQWGQKEEFSQSGSLFFSRSMFPQISSAQSTSLIHTKKA